MRWVDGVGGAQKSLVIGPTCTASKSVVMFDAGVPTNPFCAAHSPRVSTAKTQSSRSATCEVATSTMRLPGKVHGSFGSSVTNWYDDVRGESPSARSKRKGCAGVYASTRGGSVGRPVPITSRVAPKPKGSPYRSCVPSAKSRCRRPPPSGSAWYTRDVSSTA